MKRREVALCKDAPQDVRLAMRAKYEAAAAATEEKRSAAAAAVAAVKASGGKRACITNYLEGDAAAAKREADESLALAWAALHIPEHHIDHPLVANALNQLRADVGEVLDEDDEQPSNADKAHIRRILKKRWDGSLACAMDVAGRILNPANQEEDIFGTDAECTKVFKAFISQHADFLTSRGKGGGEGCDALLALWDGLRSSLDMKGSFGMPEAIAQRERVKARTYSMVKWWQWNGTDAPELASLAIRVLSQPVSASPCERGWAVWIQSTRPAGTASDPPSARTWCMLRAHNWNVVRNWHTRADVMPNVVPGIGEEPPIPEGYKGLEDTAEEEHGNDDVLDDEYDE
ncbi:unnamed protein product [Closterium sp. Naga37s-1]|nr:unnamed protein product [Closterium sp. Naga37s-1]